MREIGRALALDPGHDGAMETLVGLLTHPPASMPPEVAYQMKRSQADHHRHTARIGIVAYASMIAYVPLLAWIGVRQSGWVIAFYALAALCCGVSFWTSRQRNPPQAAIALAMVASQAMFLCTWPVFGPLVLLPILLVANTIAFAIQFAGRHDGFAACADTEPPLFPAANFDYGYIVLFSIQYDRTSVDRRLVQAPCV